MVVAVIYVRVAGKTTITMSRPLRPTLARGQAGQGVACCGRRCGGDGGARLTLRAGRGWSGAGQEGVVGNDGAESGLEWGSEGGGGGKWLRNCRSGRDGWSPRCG